LDHLTRFWPQLQQELQRQGVNLAPLQTGTGTRKPSSQPQQPCSPANPARDSGTELAFGGSMTESPLSRRHRSKAHSGWGGSG
jgi:hypothetical protein